MSHASALLRAGCALALGAFLCDPRGARAECPERLLTVWPEAGSSLSSNGRIVLEGYGQDRAPILEVARRGPLLVARDDEVDLTSITGTGKSRTLATVILAPAAKLRPGVSYRLGFGRAAKSEAADILSRGWLRPLTWTISTAAATPPLWTAPPWFIAFEDVGQGKDRRQSARIAVDVAATGAWRLLVEVSSEGQTWRYLVEVRRGEARLGAEPCARDLGFASGKRYSVQLSAIDSAGNVVPAPGKPVEIAPP